MDLDKLNRYLDNTASEAEMREVLAWLAADEKNRQELNALDKAFCASVLHAPRQKAGARRFPMLRGVVRHVLRAAAVVALILGVGYLVSEYRLVSLAGRMTSLEVPAGHYLSLNLDDGTKVWLNAGARLEYPAAFLRGERRVKVTGEAMFDVAHDADRPFVVETFACDVRVLGTKFAVEADASRGLFSASLLRGSVRVEDRTGYPELAPAIDNLSGGTITDNFRGMRRLRYPYTEKNLNAANYAAAVAMLGGVDNESVDLFWTKKN